LELLIKYYGVDKAIGTKDFSAMIDVTIMRCKFLAFKLQTSTKW
jgi:hypothetical protein